MKPILLLLFVFISLNNFAQKTNTANRLNGLDTAVARALKSFKAAGVAVAVIEKGNVIYSKGFGYSDYAAKTPVTTNTLFAIGSCTKAFTAGLLGVLNKDGKLDYDKPVRDYLPEVKFYTTDLNNNITVRDLMSHRTGLPRHDVSWYFFATPSRDTLVQRIQYMEPSAPLRQRWQYNNFMFMLQGAIAEKLTGKTWEQNIKESFFQPLGMTRSDASLSEWMNATDIAKGYTLENDTAIQQVDYFNISGMAPAGSINSSVTDMAKWVSLWINGGKYNGKEILSAGYVGEAMSSQMVVGGGLPNKETPDVFLENYGFGWFLSAYRGHYRVEHGGNIDGFSASTCFFPTDSIGIVVLTNQNASVVPSVVRNIIADKVLGLKYTDWTTSRKKAMDKANADGKEAMKSEVKDTAATHPATHDLASYAGVFENKGYGKLDVRLLHDSLLVNNTTHPLYIKHKNYDFFDVMVGFKKGYDTTNAMPMHYEMDNNGMINKISMELEQGVKPIVFDRLPVVKPVSADSLKNYTGNYAVTPAVTVKVYIKADSVLYLFVPGQPEYELVPGDTDAFTLKNLSGYSIQFGRNSSGAVTDVLFIQPNGKFKAVKQPG